MMSLKALSLPSNDEFLPAITVANVESCVRPEDQFALRPAIVIVKGNARGALFLKTQTSADDLGLRRNALGTGASCKLFCVTRNKDINCVVKKLDWSCARCGLA